MLNRWNSCTMKAWMKKREKIVLTGENNFYTIFSSNPDDGASTNINITSSSSSHSDNKVEENNNYNQNHILRTLKSFRESVKAYGVELSAEANTALEEILVNGISNNKEAEERKPRVRKSRSKRKHVLIEENNLIQNEESAITTTTNDDYTKMTYTSAFNLQLPSCIETCDEDGVSSSESKEEQEQNLYTRQIANILQFMKVSRYYAVGYNYLSYIL